MAFEIVDGMTGIKHISSDDMSALNIATIGESNCVLNYGNNFKMTMTNANTATLGTGVGMVGGKRFWNNATTSLTVQSGTQGQKRNDLIVARYAKTSTGHESITPVVIKGTPTTGTAADPAVTANDLKLWRVSLNGISVGEPVKLFEPVASLATIGGFVSRTIYGSKVISTKSDNPTPLIFTASEYMQLVGHKYSWTTDHVSFMNGDWGAQETRTASAIYGNGNIYAGLVNYPKNGTMRIDYAITTKA